MTMPFDRQPGGDVAAAALPTAAVPRVRFSRALLALILGQIGLHACMAGVRMAAPLQALRQGQAEWSVGFLLALFAVAPVLLSMPAGRMADRHGYHRPLYIAVAMSLVGAALAVLSSNYGVVCLAAVLTGGGANVGLITIQRTAGHMAGDNTERIRIFSWLGLAPALSNVLGPVTAGLLIDLAGFRAAFGVLMLMPLAALVWSRFVPHEKTSAQAASAAGSQVLQVLQEPSELAVPVGERAGKPMEASGALELLRLPALRHLLLVNWLISACWDVHAFVLPIFGHERGLSASAIGSILGVFALAVASVRLLIPVLAHRLSEAQVLAGAMLCACLVFAVYPFMHLAWMMGLCAIVLGLALGSVQPMIMSALHHITPAHRHGEAIALRSVAINLSSTVMPLLFGLVGTAVGVGSLFWVMGAAVGAGSFRARRL